MKSNVLDINELTDSREVYESKPNPFFNIFIYVILGLVLIFILWSALFKIENTVKISGVLEKNDDVVSIVNKNDLIIDEVNIKDNQHVKKGDLLYTLQNDDIKKSYKDAKELLDDEKSKYKILNDYANALKGNARDFNNDKNNKYYDEYKARLDYLNGNKNALINSSNKENMSASNNINAYQNQLNQNNDTISKLSLLQSSIKLRVNKFSENETYYYNQANQYIANYNQTASDYDTQINELINAGASESEINIVKTKKKNTLASMESENLLSISNRIKELQESNVTLTNNINELKIGLNSIDTSLSISNSKLEEQNQIYPLIDTTKQKVKELDLAYRQAKDQYDNTVVKAKKDGYVNLKVKLTKGNLLSSGTNVLDIVSKNLSKYKAIIYVDNQKIGKIKKGMNVKCELASFPENDFGYLKGKISYISNNIKISDKDRYYYIAEIEIPKNTLKKENNKTPDLKDGMNLEARVITNRESVIRYLLKKVHLY